MPLKLFHASKTTRERRLLLACSNRMTAPKSALNGLAPIPDLANASKTRFNDMAQFQNHLKPPATPARPQRGELDFAAVARKAAQ